MNMQIIHLIRFLFVSGSWGPLIEGLYMFGDLYIVGLYMYVSE